VGGGRAVVLMSEASMLTAIIVQSLRGEEPKHAQSEWWPLSFTEAIDSGARSAW
jgi:predicted AAA+ superfamily ATPase